MKRFASGTTNSSRVKTKIHLLTLNPLCFSLLMGSPCISSSSVEFKGTSWACSKLGFSETRRFVLCLTVVKEWSWLDFPKSFRFGFWAFRAVYHISLGGRKRSFLGQLPTGPNHVPETPPPNTIILGVSFNISIWAGGNTTIQTIARQFRARVTSPEM